MGFMSPVPSAYPEDIRPGLPVEEVDEERFYQLVEFAFSTIPSNIKKHMKNVAVIVDNTPMPGLFGLYRGVPLPKKTSNQGGFLPDTITLYSDTIRKHSQDEKSLYERINITLKHETGHYFGLDHDKLDLYGY